ncbi:MAG: tetratricopeptide repeat protein, partial [Anaerolineales bacterium]|nr:tetratricopeptide repeat protein [Anaerolineales bacterium]
AAFSELARQFSRSGDRLSAIAPYLHAIDLRPSQWELRYELGQIYYDLNRFDEALEVMQDLATHRDADGQALNLLGQLYLATGELDRATRTFRAAIGRNTKSAEPYVGLGQASMVLGRFDESVAAFGQAVAL